MCIRDSLYLEAQDPDKDIQMYINSPGGSVTAGMAIYDTMQYIKCDVSTICIGMAASMGAFLLSSGAKGKRIALPNAEIMIHQPSAGTQGKVTDMEIDVEPVSYTHLDVYKRQTQSVVRSLDRLERKLGSRLFRRIFRTITVDNGSEFADCEGMERSCPVSYTHLDVYKRQR